MRQRHLPVLAVLALVLASCSNADPADSPSDAAAPSASESVAATSEASRMPTGDDPGSDLELCSEGEICAGLLEPGTYTSDAFGPTVTIELDKEWASSGELPEVGFDLARPDGSQPEFISVVAFDGAVFGSACPDDAEEVEGEATARALADHLASVPSLTVVAGPEPIDVGGIEGLQLDVEVDAPDSCEIPVNFLWVLPEVGDFHLNEGEEARIVALDAGEDVVVIVIESFPEGDHEALLADAEAILGTMEIIPAD